MQVAVPSAAVVEASQRPSGCLRGGFDFARRGPAGQEGDPIGGALDVDRREARTPEPSGTKRNAEHRAWHRRAAFAEVGGDEKLVVHAPGSGEPAAPERRQGAAVHHPA
ncbi:MAG: hypothetical protein JRG92_17260 [Deltaproteobacteria bacterium]|nr:hypothetical protein [Deltaproteobacteria bacterium]MBW2385383.1 hypothetical protein [Deltaproteobacteria bacterium]MBW2695379.1 hypothetical protein [Deltaproteobacteria bacterium]